MIKAIKKTGFLMLALSVPSISFAASWSSERDIGDVYFTQNSSTDYTIVELDTDFHSCDVNGNNNDRAHLVPATVGADAFKTMNAVLLAAKMANRKISIKFDGCVSNITHVRGIRLGD